MILILVGITFLKIETITLPAAITNITETVITTAGSSLTVIASAEHIPNTWTVIGLSSSRGSVNNALFFLKIMALYLYSLLILLKYGR